MTRVYLLSFLAGIVSALLFATVNVDFVLAMIVAPFTPVPLYLAGLSLGLRAALLAGVAASVLVGLAPGALHFYVSLMYAALILGPTALMVRQALLSRERADGAREWYPAGRLLSVLVAAMSGLFLLAYGLFAATGEGLLATLTGTFEAAFQALGSPDAAAPAEALPLDAARATAEMLVQWMPASLVLGSAVSMLLAHGVLLRLNKAIRPSFDLMRLELPAALTYALAGCVLLALLAPGELGLIGRALALALAVTFVFLGLTVVHAFARRLSGGGVIVLILVYGIMLFGYPAAAIAAVGVLERWLRLRARAAGSGAAAKG